MLERAAPPDEVLEAEDLSRAVESRLLAAGFSVQDLECTFENFDPEYGGNGHAVEKCRRYADEFRRGLGWGLLLWGPVGVGKSHLAAATFRAITTRAVAKGVRFSAHKWKLPAILARGRSLFEDTSGLEGLVEELSSLHLCWLDEFSLDCIGSGVFERARAVETLYRVVDALVEARAGLLVTTNAPPDRLRQELRTLDPSGRILDRLQGVLVPVGLSGESYRRRWREERVPEWAR